MPSTPRVVLSVGVKIILVHGGCESFDNTFAEGSYNYVFKLHQCAEQTVSDVYLKAADVDISIGHPENIFFL